MILVCTRQFVKYPDSRVTRYLYTLAQADGRDVNRVMAEFVLAHPVVRTKKLSVQTKELWQRELWRWQGDILLYLYSMGRGETL